MIFTEDDQYTLAFAIRSLILDEATQEDMISKLFSGTLSMEEQSFLLHHLDKRKQDMKYWSGDCDDITEQMLPLFTQQFQKAVDLVTSYKIG